MTHPRIGLIGTGWGITITLPALRAEGWDVPVLWSRTPAKAEAQAAAHGIPHHTADYQALLRRDDIDAVVIVVPTPSHHDLDIAALQAGKHVIVEKPFAMNLDQARAIHAAAGHAHSHGVPVTAMINFEFRFTPARLHVQRLIAEGYIGDLRHANIELDWNVGSEGGPLIWRDRADQGGGILNEHGSHYIDLCRQWFGEITDVSARLASLAPNRRHPDSGDPVQADSEDFYTATLAFANGGVVTLTQTWAAPAKQGMRANIVGSQGALALSQVESMPIDAPLFGAQRGEAELRELPRPVDLPPLDPDPNWRVATTRRLLREFERGIRERRSPAPNLDDALRCQAVLDAARESARSGRTVSVPSV